MKALPILILILSLLVCPAMAAESEGEETADEQISNDSITEEAVLSLSPPDLKATLFMRFGGGAAQTRGRFAWDGDYADRPLDGNVLTSSGYVNQLGITAWFYPTVGQRFILIAEIYGGGNSTKIHYSGEGEDLVRKKFINYSCINLMGGLGHRFWFGKKQRYSMTYFVEAGPGVAGGEVENVAYDLTALGGEFLAGASIQYHYSTRIIFGGMFNAGYRSYVNQEQNIDAAWSAKNESAEFNMTSAYVSFCALIGYDF